MKNIFLNFISVVAIELCILLLLCNPLIKYFSSYFIIKRQSIFPVIFIISIKSVAFLVLSLKFYIPLDVHNNFLEIAYNFCIISNNVN